MPGGSDVDALAVSLAIDEHALIHVAVLVRAPVLPVLGAHESEAKSRRDELLAAWFIEE